MIKIEILTDPQILARRPDQVLIDSDKKKERTWCIVDFAVPADHRKKAKR